jgi:hypothetical protein
MAAFAMRYSDYGLDGRGIGGRAHVVHTGSGVHPDAYPMGTGGFLPLG